MTPKLLDLAMAPDPAAQYARLRSAQGQLAWVELEAGVGAWLVMGHEEILTVTREETRFSRDGRAWRLFQEGVVDAGSPLAPMMFWRPNVTGSDKTEHRRLRAPLEDALTRIDQRRLRQSIERTCQDLIEEFASRGEADLVGDYAVVISMLALADLCGLNTGQGHELLAAMRLLVGSVDGAVEGNQRFETVLYGEMQARRTCPAADVTTTLLQHPLLADDSEILHSLIVLTTAGYHTLIAWIASALRLLLTDTAFAHRLHGGRLSTSEALDLVLWDDPPMTHLPARYALEPTELAGKQIRRGDALILGLTAAASDPRICSTRRTADNRSHLAWSAGPHTCPARTPARLIAHTAVDTLLKLLPGLRLAIPATEIPLVPALWSRCPATLPVTFSPPA